MIKRMLIALACIVLVSNASYAGIWDSVTSFFNQSSAKVNDSLKILVVHDTPGAIIEVKGKYKIYDPNTMMHMGKGYNGKRKYIQPLQDGIKWGEEFPGVFQIVVAPEEKTTTIIVDGIEYKGSIHVYDIGGSLSIVNDISFDEYAKTLLSTKLKQPLPEEALAALAITARTNAYYMQENAKSDFWDIDAREIQYQGYALSTPSNSIEQAVRGTHNMVLKSATGPFLAQWDVVGETLSNVTPEDAKISFDQAAMFAHQGEHAAQILKKAFPNAQVDLFNN